MYAMASIAVHDALNAIDRRYRSYSLRAGQWPNASTAAAVAAAARTVLVSVIGELPDHVRGLPAGRASRWSRTPMRQP